MADLSTNQIPRTMDLIAREMDSGLHIGAQVFASRDNQIVADFALGEARPGVPMTTETVMLWMSATKPTGAVAIGQLWEKGLLDLDDPVARHVPEFAQHGKERITIRHILTHTAGIRWIETGWPHASFDEVVAKVCAMRPERDWVPGRKAGYSAYVSWYILGEIVRRLSGGAYADYVREEIFLPLGMSDCWIAMPPEVYHGYGDRLGIMQKTEGGAPVDLGLDTEAACTNPRPSGSGHGTMRGSRGFIKCFSPAAHSIRIASSCRKRSRPSPPGIGRECTISPSSTCSILAWASSSTPTSMASTPSPTATARMPHPARSATAACNQPAAFADPENDLAIAIVFNGTPGEVKHDRRIREVLTMMYEEMGIVG